MRVDGGVAGGTGKAEVGPRRHPGSKVQDVEHRDVIYIYIYIFFFYSGLGFTGSGFRF